MEAAQHWPVYTRKIPEPTLIMGAQMNIRTNPKARLIAGLLLSAVFLIVQAAAFESYHAPAKNDEGYCSMCHPGFKGGRSDTLHSLHTGGSDPITTNCDLCHTGSGRDKARCVFLYTCRSMHERHTRVCAQATTPASRWRQELLQVPQVWQQQEKRRKAVCSTVPCRRVWRSVPHSGGRRHKAAPTACPAAAQGYCQGSAQGLTTYTRTHTRAHINVTKFNHP